ncbi:phage tail tape measure protein [Pseudomonas sp. B21-023]|uniref:phage tail tape measure protein n=1 Tax=Pseudomonas sp. B21-023 TaxID=2895477 RepID=UPI002160887F|nr:phage tail tape measure protein [Pseudomonas sp. B21-023]UVM17532.1 phage tail tape measure protein [Pseudomonas sp. B21-023]
MNNVARLGVEVTSTGAVEATDELDKLASAGGKAEKATAEVAVQSAKSGVSIKELADRTKGAEQATERYARQAQAAGLSTKAYTAALRGVPAQFTDIAVSLQGGMNPFTVLLQQGGQLKDMFGGVGPATRALGGYVLGLVNPLTVTAGAMGALGLAAYQAGREQDRLNQSIILTGNYAGTTTTSLSDMARQIATTVGTTGTAISALAQVAGAGDLAGESFKIVAQTAIEMERATGKSIDETIAEFRKIADDPVKAAEELNKRYHWLTASTLEQVRALVDQGEKTEAVRLVTEQFGETMTRRAQIIREEMSGLPKLFDDIGEAAGRMWDGIKGVWRDPTLDKVADGLRLQIQSMENIRKEFRNEKNYDPEKLKVWRTRLAEIEGLSKPAGGAVTIQGQGDNDKLNAMLDRAAPKAEKLADRMKEIDRLVASNRKQGFTVTDEQVEQLRARARKDFKETKTPTTPVNLTDVKDSRNALSMILSDYRGYEKELNAIQKSGVISQDAVYAQRVAMAKQQRADVTGAYMEEIQALEEAKGRASTTGEQRIQLDQRIAKARSEMVRAQREADSELAVLATNERGRQEQQIAASKAFVDQLERERQALVTAGDRAAASLGLSDRQAGLQRDLDSVTDEFNRKRDTLLDRRRIAPDKYSADDYRRDLADLEVAENKYRDTVVSNYEKMTAAQGEWRSGVSSGFQNYLDSARDFAGQAQTVVTGAFEGMEDALVQFTMTGKLSFADFTKSVLADMARIAARQAITGIAGSLFGSAIGGFFGGGASTAGSGRMTGFSETISDVRVNAKGGVYDSPSLSHFSNQVHSSPQFFAFAKGAGVFGEAGPEAIMPLTRAPDGNLGVRALGRPGSDSAATVAAPVSVSITINSDGSTQVESKAPMMDQFGKEIGALVEAKYRKLLSMDLRPDGAIGRTMQRR